MLVDKYLPRIEFDSYEDFKQKTAYEIDVCDWSSDVCSSDLYDLEY